MTNEDPTKPRVYRKRKRAEQEEQTRERITAAAVKLHGSVGPARTTVSGIAKEAGVQRATVYRHFPDEESLFAACSAHYWSEHPPPDPGRWRTIADPSERLRSALGELYPFYRDTQQMLALTSRDAPLVPAMTGPVAAFAAYIEEVGDAIVRGRPERGKARSRVRAAVGHAIAFATWRSLAIDQGLEDGEAAALMEALVGVAGEAG